MQLPVLECVGLVSDASSVDVRRKAGEWVKVVRSRLKTPDKLNNDPLPLDDSAKKTRRKFVKYFSHFVILKLGNVLLLLHGYSRVGKKS